jgi:hypothetical protein
MTVEPQFDKDVKMKSGGIKQMGDREEKAYGQGVKDAENAGILDSICHDLGKALNTTKADQSYDQGWKDAMDGKASSKDKK